MKISFHSHANAISFLYEKISTRTRFEKEAKGNSEMAYYEWFNFTCYHPPGNPRGKSNPSGLGVGNASSCFLPGLVANRKYLLAVALVVLVLLLSL